MKEMTLLEMQDRMRSGKLTARTLSRTYLDRIEELDRQGPEIRSVIEPNPDALAIAAALDRERKAGHVRGPLHGIPILIKDNIDTHDRMQTTAGSLALEGSIAARDAFIVERLRAAGAVILGKTNLSEWANFRGKRSISGWSSRGGLTRNPYALDRSASGSSSGSAVAVAANMCAAAVGTETDATILLGAMVGTDPHDPATRPGRKRGLADYTPFLDPEGLKEARIGVARNMAGTDPRILQIFEKCIEVMQGLGAVIVDPADVPNFDKFGKTELGVLYYEFKADLNTYLNALRSGARVKSLADVIRFNAENRAAVMLYFGQEHMEIAQRKGPLTSKHLR